jgi:hypothetical protein
MKSTKRKPQKRRVAVPRKGTARSAKDAVPRKESIVSVGTITSPKGRRYTILETDQLDPYDDPQPKAGKRRG